MLRATHVASVSRQDCRALFAKLSDVEHQLEPCGDGRRAAVCLKWDSNTVPKCPAAAGRGEHQASRGLGWWVVTWARGMGPCGLAHTRGVRAMRGVGQGARMGRLVHPRVLTAWEAGSVWLGPHATAPLLTRAFSIPSRARACLDCRGGEAKHAGRVDGGGRGGEGGRGEGAEATAAERASGRRRRGAVRRSARVGRRRGGGEGGGARGGYRWRRAAAEKRAVTEKAAADIEWNGGTACKEKGLSPLPPL